MNRCQICQNTDGNRLHVAREMAYGMGDSFTYLECGRCGCVQLLDVPADLGRYYPPDYYSLQPHGALKTFVRHRWSAHAYGRKNLVGWLVTTFYGPRRSMQAVARVNPPRSARILDVGCGRGALLQDLAWLGFQNLFGADPYIPHELAYPDGVRVYKRALAEMPGDFDLIMMHHSFEHMPEPLGVMRAAAERLRPGGQLIVALPTASSYAWRHYGVNWVALDAPRHLFLHTRASMELLAQACGLHIEQIVQEGDAGQFLLSEQYQQGIPLHDPRSFNMNFIKMLRHWRYVRECRRRAGELNQRGESDLVCYHLRKRA